MITHNKWPELPLKITEVLYVYYSQEGHYQYPEDTWEQQAQVNSITDLLRFIKSVHKHDAYNFNNYPFGGSCATNLISFYVEKSVVIDDIVYTSQKIFVEPPAYFQEAVSRYEDLIHRAKITIPNLRRIRATKNSQYKAANYIKEIKEKYPQLRHL